MADQLPKAPFPKVVSQEVRQEYGDDGQRHKRWRINIEHTDGTRSFIEVNDENHIVEYVAHLMQDEANRVHAINILQRAPEERQ